MFVRAPCNIPGIAVISWFHLRLRLRLCVCVSVTVSADVTVTHVVRGLFTMREMHVIAPDSRRDLCEARLCAVLARRDVEVLPTLELQQIKLNTERLHLVDNNNTPHGRVQAWTTLFQTIKSVRMHQGLAQRGSVGHKILKNKFKKIAKRRRKHPKNTHKQDTRLLVHA